MQHVGHFLGRFAFCSGVGHAQGGRNAIGRKEEVAVMRLQLVVEIEAKGVVPFHDRSLGIRGRLIGAEIAASDAEKEKESEEGQ